MISPPSFFITNWLNCALSKLDRHACFGTRPLSSTVSGTLSFRQRFFVSGSTAIFHSLQQVKEHCPPIQWKSP